jgi:hypothetical protein
MVKKIATQLSGYFFYLVQQKVDCKANQFNN